MAQPNMGAQYGMTAVRATRLAPFEEGEGGGGLHRTRLARGDAARLAMPPEADTQDRVPFGWTRNRKPCSVAIKDRDGIVVPDRCQRSKSVRVRNWEVGSGARTPTTEGDTQWVQRHRHNLGSLAFHYYAPRL